LEPHYVQVLGINGRRAGSEAVETVDVILGRFKLLLPQRSAGVNIESGDGLGSGGSIGKGQE